MNTYLVGGAVRDALLGLQGSDRDWVVVGSTAEAMVAQGFTPVGRDRSEEHTSELQSH